MLPSTTSLSRGNVRVVGHSLKDPPAPLSDRGNRLTVKGETRVSSTGDTSPRLTSPRRVTSTSALGPPVHTRRRLESPNTRRLKGYSAMTSHLSSRKRKDQIFENVFTVYPHWKRKKRLSSDLTRGEAALFFRSASRKVDRPSRWTAESRPP